MAWVKDFYKLISIHALREEGDDKQQAVTETKLISIHALREEGDRCARLALWMADNFYPRPPRGGRQMCQTRALDGRQFLSTPSARRATDGDRLSAENY